MSRTDAHMPYWVTCTWYEPSHRAFCDFEGRTRFREQRFNRETRNWEDLGWVPAIPCTLPPTPTRRAGVQRWDQCHWRPDWNFYGPNRNFCGCSRCTGQDERKHDNRARRAAERAMLRTFITACPEDREDLLDVPEFERRW